MKEKKHHSPFTRVSVTKDGGEKIKQLQHEFDRFWKKVNKVSDKCPEKFHAMKAMQEACMWLSRACALQNENYDVIIDDPAKPTEKEKMIMLNVPGRREGKSFQNNPTIVVKRKKV